MKDVEKTVMSWIRSRYKNVRAIRITKIWREQDFWSVDVEFEIPTETTFGFDPLLPASLRSRGIKRMRRFQVDRSSGEVIGVK